LAMLFFWKSLIILHRSCLGTGCHQPCWCFNMPLSGWVGLSHTSVSLALRMLVCAGATVSVDQ
jgi:hypothetical protein